MIVKDNRESLEEKAAWIIADAIQDLLEEQEQVILAVPGGRSVANIFEHLKGENIDWGKVHLFMVDERMVPIDDKDSNYLLVKEHLLDHIDIPEVNAHPFDYHNPATYERELGGLGGKYDLVLVSSGEDGHIAGLFPYHHSISDRGVYLTFEDSPKMPPSRMSSSRELIERSGTGIVLFFGEGKREAYKAFTQEGPIEACPARLVKSLPQWYALTDQEAE